MTRLNQVLAIEKGVKTRVYADFTNLHNATKKAELLEGFTKNYIAKDETGETHPSQDKRVQHVSDDVFKQAQKLLSELFDITATKDWANCGAKADIKVDGVALLKDVPTTYLLFLDKQLSDIHKFISAFVELDSSVEWTKDPVTGYYRSPLVRNQSTKKVQRPIVMYDATEHHPAQTQMITEDVVVGHWETTRMSGALPRVRKQVLLERTEKLLNAVKFALEQANTVEAHAQTIGGVVFGYLFGE